MGDVEQGTCSICREQEVPVSRKYYRYAIDCECCNGVGNHHFAIVWYCKKCTPKPPERIHVTIKPYEEKD
jgi:hypothetical protein